jgi:hypothetical protein
MTADLSKGSLQEADKERSQAIGSRAEASPEEMLAPVTASSGPETEYQSSPIGQDIRKKPAPPAQDSDKWISTSELLILVTASFPSDSW